MRGNIGVCEVEKNIALTCARRQAPIITVKPKQQYNRIEGIEFIIMQWLRFIPTVAWIIYQNEWEKNYLSEVLESLERCRHQQQ